MPDVARAILLVEDSDDDVLFFKRAIKLADVANPVMRVSSGEEAIAYLTGEGQYADRTAFPMPFAVMLDLRLPGTQGLEVLKWIRSQPQLNKIFVAVLSGNEQGAVIEETLDSGANKFLSKPCKPAELRTLTEEFPGEWQTSLPA